MADSTGNPAPIVVNASPIPGTLAGLFRTIVVTACTAGVADGFFGQTTADQLIPIGIALLTLGYGIVKNYAMHSNLRDLANLLPDSQAIAK